MDADDAANPTLAWLDDGTILYEQGLITGQQRRIAQIPEDGGEPLVVFTPEEGAGTPSWLQGLPGGRGALVATCGPAIATCDDNLELYVVDLRDLSSELIMEGVLRAWYAPTGHLVYVQLDGAVFAAPFDLGALAITGGAIPLFDGVSATTARAQMQLAADGTLLYVEAAPRVNEREFVWVTRSGQATLVEGGWSFRDGADPTEAWSLSPDGMRLALRAETEAGYDIWIKQLPNGPLSRLTFYEGMDTRPRWVPDGGSVTFLSDRSGNYDVWSQRADGTGEPQVLFDGGSFLLNGQGFWSPAGEWLVLRPAAPGSGSRDILALRPGVDSVPLPLLTEEYHEQAPALSPDGRWLAYVSTETGSPEVFVRPFPDVDSGKWQVSTDGGIMPLWAHSGRELFYVDGSRGLVAVQVETDPSFQVGAKEILFTLPPGYRTIPVSSLFDITPDDQRFLMVREVGSDENSTNSIILVTNFFEELKARVPN